MTDYMQPINPIRIVTGDKEWSFSDLVFAIAITNQHDVEYLTVNGVFWSPAKIKFAEMCINGQWVRMESHHYPPT